MAPFSDEYMILKNTSDWITGHGIISILTQYYNVPWRNDYVCPYQSDLNVRYNISGADLDLDYYANRSQHKVISPLVEALLDDDGELSDTALRRLAGIIYGKYGENWDRIFYAFSLNYNPLQNYNGDETETTENEVSGSKSNSVTRGENSTDTGTVGVSGQRTNTGTQAVQGTNTGTQSDSGTKLNTGTQAVQGTNTGTQSDSGSKSNTGTETTTESGTDNTTFGNTNYQEITTVEKDDSDTLTFPVTRTSTQVTTGGYTDTHTESNHTRDKAEWGNEKTTNKTYAFNSSSAVNTDETEFSYGNGTTPSETNAKHTKETETGGYTDGRVYNSNSVATTEAGSEKHVISADDTTTLSISGSKSQNETKNLTNQRTDNLSETTSNTRTDNLSHSETRTDDLSESTSNTRTDNLEHSETRTDNLTETNSETTTNNLSHSLSGTESGTETSSENGTVTRQNHREGNLGVTTSQQMLTSEIDMRIALNLFNTVVYPNIDEVMCLTIFRKEYIGNMSKQEYVLPVASASTLGGIKIGNGLSILPDGTVSVVPYELPMASPNTLGGVKVGNNLSIDQDGVLSATDTQYELPAASSNTLGGVKVGENLSIDENGVLSASGGSQYELPVASFSRLGGIKVGSGLSINSSGVLSSQYEPPTDFTIGGTLNASGVLFGYVGVAFNMSKNYTLVIEVNDTNNNLYEVRMPLRLTFFENSDKTSLSYYANEEFTFVNTYNGNHYNGTFTIENDEWILSIK